MKSRISNINNSKLITHTIPVKNEGNIHIFTLNISTLSTRNPMKIFQLIKYLHDNQIDITMINETTMNYQNTRNITLIKQSIKRIWIHNRTVFASTPDIHTKNYDNTIPLRQQGDC